MSTDFLFLWNIGGIKWPVFFGWLHYLLLKRKKEKFYYEVIGHWMVIIFLCYLGFIYNTESQGAGISNDLSKQPGRIL